MGLLFAAPVVLLVVAGVLVTVVFGRQVRNELLSSSFLAMLLLLDVALLGWRLFAIAHAAFGDRAEPRAGAQRLGRPSTATLVAVGLLAILAIGMHAYIGLVVGRLNAALDQVFSGTAGIQQAIGVGDDAPNARPGSEPLNEPQYRWNGTGRINFLLLGVDAGPGREESLTDTILVVSVDPVVHDAIMVSIPRDTGFMPLPDTSIYPDGLYPEKINALASEASYSPELWCPDLPEPAECGVRTLERSVGLYLGITIHHYAIVDLEGFADLMDSIGGVRLCLPGRLVDPQYSGPTWSPRVGIELPAGCNHYDGAEALAFARIRKGELIRSDGSIEPQNDFKRAERQQEVLLALRSELAASDLIFELPALLDAIGATVSSDFPRAKAGDLATLLPLIAGPDIERVVLGLPDFVEAPVDPELNYLLTPKRSAIRAEAKRLFGDDSELSGWYVGSHATAPPATSPDPIGSPPAG